MSFAILHEGKKVDKEFINLVLKELKLDNSLVSYYGFSSKNNFFNKDYQEYKDLILEVKSQRVKKILFILDADYIENDKRFGGFDNTTKELQKVIEQLKIDKISNVCIMCDPNTKNGYLESLILSTIPKEQKNCIEDFLNCSNFESKENHKAILNQIYKIAYPQAPYDFKHKNFNNLKTKLKNLFKEER